MRQEGGQRPVIVYCEDKAQVFDPIFQKSCQRTKIPFLKVTTKEEAANARSLMKKESRGLIRVARKYSRGLDLKLEQDAIVIVIATGNTLKYTEVRQMFGRGCRSQGATESWIFMSNPNNLGSNMLWQAIVGRKEAVISDCSKNLIYLRDALKHASQDLLKQIRGIYDNNAWKVTCSQFSLAN